VHSDSPTASMTRLSYARMLLEIDLLVVLPSLINITLPNGVFKFQAVLYKSLPRFYKQCKTLGHSTSACTKALSHKRKKHPPTASAPSGCSNPLADIEAIEKQSIREELQGEPDIDPIAAEAAMVVEESAGRSVRKRAKLALQPVSPHASSDSPHIVHISEDRFNAATALPPRRHYLTRSKVAATSAFGQSGKSLEMRGQPSKRSSSADSRIQGSTASTPSSFL